MEKLNCAVIGVVGTGLIGTSLALALKDQVPDQHILGYDLNKTYAQQAKNRGAFDDLIDTPFELAVQCDILVIATPVGAVHSIFEQIKNLVDQMIITDVGSTKRSVIAAARSVWGEVPMCMVPAHPIAGGENSGPAAASKDLFRSCQVFLTPQRQSDVAAVDTVRELWQKVGANIELLSPVQHDELFAATSHLPHIVAYALMHSLKLNGVNTAFSAGGLKDFTRVAASDPVMWRDIFMANSDHILNAIEDFATSLSTMRKMIEAKQDAQLFELLKEILVAKKKLPIKY